MLLLSFVCVQGDFIIQTVLCTYHNINGRSETHIGIQTMLEKYLLIWDVKSQFTIRQRVLWDSTLLKVIYEYVNGVASMVWSRVWSTNNDIAQLA